MQSVNHPIYTYDARGRLTNYTPSGASNDVVSQHVFLDPRIPGPRSLPAGGLLPKVSSKGPLYVPPLSLTSPPVSRPQTVATLLGYHSVQDIPEAQDVYGITTAAPLLPPGQHVKTPPGFK